MYAMCWYDFASMVDIGHAEGITCESTGVAIESLAALNDDRA